VLRCAFAVCSWSRTPKPPGHAGRGPNRIREATFLRRIQSDRVTLAITLIRALTRLTLPEEIWKLCAEFPTSRARQDPLFEAEAKVPVLSSFGNELSRRRPTRVILWWVDGEPKCAFAERVAGVFSRFARGIGTG
jgi:hypothetical protein